MNGSISRRDWILRTAGMVPALPVADAWLKAGLFAQDSAGGVASAVKKQLVVQTETPFNAEGPLQVLGESWITPLESFFVRCNGNVPKLDLSSFTLNVDGMVNKPITIKIDELMERFPSVKATATLTCAGNRRHEFALTSKKASGLQWKSGAMGNAEWGGVRLSDILKLAGIAPDAKHVWFEGVDKVIEKSESFPFGASIPLDKAMADSSVAPGALLATQMNGRPLLPEHGFPLRTVVPGFVGARSVKWLGRITVSDRPSPNSFVSKSYKIVTEDTPEAYSSATPLYDISINSLITSPVEGAKISEGKLTVKGVAMAPGLSGRGVKTVEVSTDNGLSWKQAKLTSSVRDFCWVTWSADVAVTAATENLLARCIDSAGVMQPQSVAWNAKGYQYNAWHRVAVKVG